MLIVYTVHQSARHKFADHTVTVTDNQAERMLRYLRTYERSTGPFTGRYPSLGITVHKIST